ncbi:ketosteroid isomerase-like protein [Paenibacillus sp. LBL]|uniref:YybH family protein n=1 Tax=Paenibacillus sp. LBL TaxID=2940563 RepID=UPI002474FA85|nr:nuclear transport factor 2 family protein [Paenibacillus sp. LBL]MDH6673934.1 ketosteroid isomerase-like protein [Paenibacillus sp. LBL]
MSYQNALEAYIAATNTHDFDQVARLLDEEAVYWFSDRSCTTLDEIRLYFEQAWDAIREEVYRAEDVEWIASDVHSAVCIYTYHFEGYHQGTFMSGSGRATNVFIRDVEGSWKLKHEHLSSMK